MIAETIDVTTEESMKEKAIEGMTETKPDVARSVRAVVPLHEEKIVTHQQENQGQGTAAEEDAKLLQ